MNTEELKKTRNPFSAGYEYASLNHELHTYTKNREELIKYLEDEYKYKTFYGLYTYEDPLWQAGKNQYGRDLVMSNLTGSNVSGFVDIVTDRQNGPFSELYEKKGDAKGKKSKRHSSRKKRNTHRKKSRA